MQRAIVALQTSRTMSRAIIYRKTGLADVFEFIKDYQCPPRKEGEVRIAVKSTSWNPIDAKFRNGERQITLPKVPGGDLAGIVVEADAASKFKPNDAVFGLTNGYALQHGTWTELVNAPEDTLAYAPSTLSLEKKAGAVPLSSLAAFQGLSCCNLKPGDRILIHAGSGGVGHFAVQLAKNHWGAYVVSTSRNTSFVKGLGADEVLDYSKEDFAERFKAQPFDAILDVIGGDTEVRSYSVLKKGGVYAHIKNTGTDLARVEEGKKWTDRTYALVISHPSGSILSEIAKFIDEGKLKVHVSDVIPLERGKEAEELSNRKTGGKIVVTI